MEFRQFAAGSGGIIPSRPRIVDLVTGKTNEKGA